MGRQQAYARVPDAEQAEEGAMGGVDHSSPSTALRDGDPPAALKGVEQAVDTSAAGDSQLLAEHRAEHRGSLEPSSSGRGSLWSRAFGCCNQVQTWIWGSGLASIALASTIMSINALLIKILVVRIPVMELVVARGTFCWIVSVTVRRLQGYSAVHGLFGQRQNYLALLVRGVTGCLSMTAYYFALQYLTLGDTMTLFFFNPAITAVLAWVLLGEALSLWGILGVVASLAGVVLVAQPPFLFGTPEPWTTGHIIGVSMAIAASFLAAAAFVSIRYMCKESALSIALCFHTCSIIIGIVPMLIGWPDKPVMPEPTEAVIMLFVGATSFVGQILIGRGYQLELASKVAAVNYLQVVFATIFGVALLGDHLSWLGLAGSVMIAAGVILANMSKSTPSATSPDVLASAKASAFAMPGADAYDGHSDDDADDSAHPFISADHHVKSHAVSGTHERGLGAGELSDVVLELQAVQGSAGRQQ